jgi:hypothetical protein
MPYYYPKNYLSFFQLDFSAPILPSPGLNGEIGLFKEMIFNHKVHKEATKTTKKKTL